tara:strand:- start:353 stop:562 length:210 start_codon:yes stop_codon:yes gene_type:complete
MKDFKNVVLGVVVGLVLSIIVVSVVGVNQDVEVSNLNKSISTLVDVQGPLSEKNSQMFTTDYGVISNNK